MRVLVFSVGRVLVHISKKNKVQNKNVSSKKKHELFDKLILFLAALWPLANVPQVLHVYIARDVSGLSLASWSLYLFFTIPWMIYGFLHKEKLIMFAYAANFILFLLVVIGILIY